MIVQLPRIPLEREMFRCPLGDFEPRARDHDVGGVGAGAPFLAVGAVAQGCGHGVAGVGVGDGAAHAGAGGHF